LGILETNGRLGVIAWRWHSYDKWMALKDSAEDGEAGAGREMFIPEWE
jgi:hypothetical protein